MFNVSVDVDSLKGYLAMSSADRIFYCTTTVTPQVLEDLCSSIYMFKESLASICENLKREKELMRAKFELVDHVPAVLQFFNSGR